MNIGQLARLTGAPIDTIRYYERQQLLPSPQRSASGYRQYGDDDVARLSFILRAKTLGFSLQEIAELLAISASRNDDMAAVKQAASVKLARIEAQQAELARVHAALLTLIDACPGHGALDECPIIAALGSEPA
jgi:MerR family transcriptional regulator, copper efflux regulator